MDTNQNLQQAVMLVKQGNRDGALQIINRILETDPLNERAWLGYAYAVPDRQAGIQALEKVLELNPNNQAARRQLDLWMMQPVPDGFTPIPAPESAPPAPATGFVYTPIPDPSPAPEMYTPPAVQPPPVEEIPSWLTPTLAAEESAPVTGSAFGVYDGYQSPTETPVSAPEPLPVPVPAGPNPGESLYEAEKPEEEPGDPQIRILKAMLASQESTLEEQKKSFKYVVEYNNNLANVLNNYSRQMSEMRRQFSNLFTSVLVVGSLVLVAIIVLLVK
ncbi:MAG: hypothetical protein HGA53_03130 [Anaerolineaceae bacterium]|nr:hypothetical protein [Anaerolineaceae bacterium]